MKKQMVHILCWSAVSQFVARQHDRVLTYSGFVQRHLTSRLEQLPADRVELLKQVCYNPVSYSSEGLESGRLTAQAGTAVRFWANTTGIPSRGASKLGLMPVS